MNSEKEKIGSVYSDKKKYGIIQLVTAVMLVAALLVITIVLL